MSKKKYKASVSVFLSMIMLLLMGLVMCLIEVTKVYNMQAYRRLMGEGAIESVFGEYHVGLQSHYGLFGLDGSYKSGDYSISNVMERYSFYGGNGDESQIVTLQLMTDNQGAGFLDQVMYYMLDSVGLSYLENMLGINTQWESIDIEEGEQGASGLADIGTMKDSLLGTEDNPLATFFDFDFNGILDLVWEDKNSLSTGEVDQSQLCSQRELEVGYGTTSTVDRGSVATKVGLSEYVLGVLDYADASTDASTDVSTDANTDEESDTLRYQVEYLIGGGDSDKENLKSVVHKLLLIRTPVNYACLQGDSVKKAEVEVVAIAIATATGALGTESLIAQSLLWAWSWAESIVDVRSLLSGGNLTLTKSSSQWQLDISSLMDFGSGSVEASKGEDGMDYKDFLRILLYLESIDTLTQRTMDMVELSVKNIDGMEQFKLDHCISRLSLSIETEVGMGYSYSFPIEYGYR